MCITVAQAFPGHITRITRADRGYLAEEISPRRRKHTLYGRGFLLNRISRWIRNTWTTLVRNMKCSRSFMTLLIRWTHQIFHRQLGDCAILLRDFRSQGLNKGLEILLCRPIIRVVRYGWNRQLDLARQSCSGAQADCNSIAMTGLAYL